MKIVLEAPSILVWTVIIITSFSVILQVIEFVLTVRIAQIKSKLKSQENSDMKTATEIINKINQRIKDKGSNQ